MPLFKKVQGGLDRVLSLTRENLSGVRVIRAFNKQEKEIERFASDNQQLTNMQIVVGRISGLTNPLTYIIINCSIIAVIWIGGQQVYEGVISQGEVVALVSYMSQILVELVKLANLIVNVSKSLTCANRIAEILDTKSNWQECPTQECPAEAEKTSVCFSHVSMCYEGAAEEALEDIQLSVQKGQTVGIIGGTGSGKSTLVHMIPRFYDVSKGAVCVNGKDVRAYDMEELRKKIGIVPQKAVLFAGTIAENLRWGNENATEEELWQAIEMAQAGDVVRGKEGGLNYRIEEGGKNLSGGQRQRLTIARALVRKPEILILDDSASALDFATDAALRQAIRSMQGEQTIFIVSQRTSSIQLADVILVLEDGRVVGTGTHKELLENCEVYKEIYDSQVTTNTSN